MVACLSRCLYLFFNFVIPNGSYRNTESRTSFHIVTSEHTFLTSVHFQHLNLHCKLTKSMNFPYPIRLRVGKKKKNECSFETAVETYTTQFTPAPHPHSNGTLSTTTHIRTISWLENGIHLK